MCMLMGLRRHRIGLLAYDKFWCCVGYFVTWWIVGTGLLSGHVTESKFDMIEMFTNGWISTSKLGKVL